MKVNEYKTKFLHKKRLCALLSCLIVITIANPLFAFAKPAEHGKIVRVGWFDSSYNTMDEAGRRTGYCYEYERKIATYTGWKYEYVEGSWVELMDKLKKGEIDMLGDVSYTEERTEEMLFPSYAIGTEEYHLYIPNECVVDYNMDNSFVNGKKIAVNKGSVQVAMFREWSEKDGVSPETEEVSIPEKDVIDKMHNGDFVGFVTLDNYLNSEHLVPVAKIGSSDFYFAISKSRKDLLAELDIALSRIQDENRFYAKQLHEKYNQYAGEGKFSDVGQFLNSEEMEWLSGHGAIRVGYIDDRLAYCDKDDESGELNGVLKDYLNKASESFVNKNIDYETHAYKRVDDALAALENGEIDCVFPANFSEYEGEVNGIVLTPSIVSATLYAVVKISEQWSFTNKGKITAAILSGDFNYESIVKGLYPDWDIIYCDDDAACLKAVSSGEADCFVISSYRYNSLHRLCDKYKLTTFALGKGVEFCFAAKEGETELYSILAKTANIIPDSYIDSQLVRYFSEEGKETLSDIINDNIVVVIFVILAMLAMLMLIIVQGRLINAEKKANEQRRIADELNRRVYVDALTSVRNKGAYENYKKMLYEQLESGEVTEFAICAFDCDDLKNINDRFGHEKGDEYLKAAAKQICNVFSDSLVFRVGGDEFIAVLKNDDYKNREELIKLFEEESLAINRTVENEWQQVNVSLGMAEYDPNTDRSVEDTANRADTYMYENKRERKARL